MAQSSSLLANRLRLPNGSTIPQIHLGLYMMSQREATASIPSALSLGYRAFDCAQMYHNEREAGRTINSYLKDNDLTREDIFYTSKLSDNSTSYEAVRKSITGSVKACGLGYIDLFLLHSPYGGKQARLTSWKAVEDAIEEGEVKMGGVSNYGVAHIEELMASTPKIAPAVNQIEVHPFNTQTSIRATCAKFNIGIEAYAPLARGMRMRHPTIVDMAGKYTCSPAQLFVRWGIQLGFVTLPKSVREERMKENADVGWFEITAQDMETLEGLNEGLVTDWDPTDAP